MTDNQNFLQRARLAIFGLQQKRARDRRREQIENEKERVELELFLDDAVSGGYDLSDPAHLAIIIRAWMLKNGEEIADDDGMSQDHRGLEF